MQHLFLDCSHGMSGDMTLASLAHLGVDLSPPAGPAGTGGRGLPPGGLAGRTGRRARLPGGGRLGGGGPAPAAPGGHRRHLRRRARAGQGAPQGPGRAGGPDPGRGRGPRHRPEKVHFHEVGAVDTLVDILGACWALDRLGVERVTACALPWFGGSITCAHGEIPAGARHGQPHARPARASHRCQDGTGDPHRRGPWPVCWWTSSWTVRQAVCWPWARATAHVRPHRPAGLARGGPGAPAGRSRPGRRRGRDAAGMPSRPSDRREELGTALEMLAAADGVLDVLWLPGTGKKNRPAGSAGALPPRRYGNTSPGPSCATRTPWACGASCCSAWCPQGHDPHMRRNRPARQGIRSGRPLVCPAGGRRRGPSGCGAGTGAPAPALWEKMKAFSNTCKNI